MTPRVAIIGGGISGTLVVLNCLKQSKAAIEIIWFDATNAFCKGLAYSTDHNDHLLNVRAGNMSLFPDEPEHFVNWLATNYSSYTAKDFVPRKVFGEYATSTYRELKNKNPLVTVTELAEEVVSIKKTTTAFTVTSKNTHTAHKVILAIGNFLPAHPRSSETGFITSENYFQNAFDISIPLKAKDKKHITIIGSGLTMIDTVIALNSSGYKGTITVISPHAYLPQPHQETTLPAVSAFIEENYRYTLPELLKLINNQLKNAKKNNLNPHSVIDVMRPYLQDLWFNLSHEDKQQFIRHLRHKWGVARHRAPAQSMAVIDKLIKENRLSVIKGRIYTIKSLSEGFELFYAGKNKAENALKTEILINCTGPESNPEKLDCLLVKQLLTDGIVVADGLKYGVLADKNGAIEPNIFTLGPPLKGVLWESTAVPEIRVQAQKLASKIISD